MASTSNLSTDPETYPTTAEPELFALNGRRVMGVVSELFSCPHHSVFALSRYFPYLYLPLFTYRKLDIWLEIGNRRIYQYTIND